MDEIKKGKIEDWLNLTWYYANMKDAAGVPYNYSTMGEYKGARKILDLLGIICVQNNDGTHKIITR